MTRGPDFRWPSWESTWVGKGCVCPKRHVEITTFSINKCCLGSVTGVSSRWRKREKLGIGVLSNLHWQRERVDDSLFAVRALMCCMWYRTPWQRDWNVSFTPATGLRPRRVPVVPGLLPSRSEMLMSNPYIRVWNIAGPLLPHLPFLSSLFLFGFSGTPSPGKSRPNIMN